VRKRRVWTSGEPTLRREKQVLGGNPVPVPNCPLWMSHGLARNITQASAVTARWLTARFTS